MKTIYYNGAVYTGQMPMCEAFAVEDGKFIFAGSSADALAMAADGDGRVDLGGAFVCAGFNDSHMHLLNYGQSLTMAPLSENTGSLHLDDFRIKVEKEKEEEKEEGKRDYVHNENFNSLATGNVTTVDGFTFRYASDVKVYEKTDATDKYLSFECGTNTAAASTPYMQAPANATVGDVLVIEADFMLGEDYKAEADLLKLTGSATLPLIYVGADGTLYDMSSGSKGNSLGVSLSKTEWTTVKVVVDFANNTKDVYVNGCLVGDGLAVASSIATDYSMNGIRILQFKGTANTGAACLDNFKCYMQ